MALKGKEEEMNIISVPIRPKVRTMLVGRQRRPDRVTNRSQPTVIRVNAICRVCGLKLKYGKKKDFGPTPHDLSWVYGAFQRVVREETSSHEIRTYFAWEPAEICCRHACAKKGCVQKKKGNNYCADCQRCPSHGDINIAKKPCRQCKLFWDANSGSEWRPSSHFSFPSHVRAQVRTIWILARAYKEDGQHRYEEELWILPNELIQLIIIYLVEAEEILCLGLQS